MDLATRAPGPFVYEAKRIYASLKHDPVLNEYDVVWVTTPPHELQLVGFWLAEYHGIPYVMDLRDPWGESTRIRWLSRGQRRNALSWYERCVLRASALVTNTPQHLHLVKDNCPPSVRSKVFLVPNGYFSADFRRLSLNATAKVTVPLLAYAGGLYGGEVERALGILHEVASERGTPIDVKIIGASTGKYPFHYCGRVPPSEVAAQILAATWLFLYMPESAASGPVMSLKAYQYARSGRPVLYMGPKNETYEYLAKRTVVVRLEDPAMALEALFRVGERTAAGNHAELDDSDSWEARLPEIERILAMAVSCNGSAANGERGWPD
jgi:hypothetical protein